MLDVLVAESAAKPGDGSYRLRSRLNQGRTILETIKIADDLIAEYEGDDIFLCFRVRRSARRRDNRKKRLWEWTSLEPGVTIPDASVFAFTETIGAARRTSYCRPSCVDQIF